MQKLSKMPEKEVFFEADVAVHRLKVNEFCAAAGMEIISRGAKHDESKLTQQEREFYIEPVWDLNHSPQPFGSPEYKAQTAKMGVGWKNHYTHNDHHLEFFIDKGGSPWEHVNMFQLIEMLCDWKAAALRKGNDPLEAIEQLKKKFRIDPQMEALLRNTFKRIDEITKEDAKT